jgi:formylmethanofuran dehydrogenase subunit B
MSVHDDPGLSETPSPDDVRATADVTCTACGCLCDDLRISVAGGRIVVAENACERGNRWFLADHGHQDCPAATVEGQPAAVDDALDRAVAILRAAKSPLVLGLTQTSTETVAEAIALADRLGAVVELSSAVEAIPRLLAVQRIGRVSATLGEVKNRADVVVFWGVDPVVTHPRHWERYSVEPRGRFVPEGRAGRHVIVVDSQKTASAERADVFLCIAPEARFATLWTLRTLLRGVTLDPGSVERATGVTLESLRALADRLKSARYGAWFTGAELGRPPCSAREVEAALALVRDLNAHTRFVIFALGSPGNATGAEAALTWQTGFAASVNLAHGTPRSLPGTTSAEALLERGEVDAALLVADHFPDGFSKAASAAFNAIPKVVIAPKATAQGNGATVAFDAATFGIDAGGTVTRTDGVVLPLRPSLAGAVPTDRQWLKRIAERLEIRR